MARPSSAIAEWAFATTIAPHTGKADIVRMDVADPSAVPTFASRTPLNIGAVGLRVRDLDRTSAFYCGAIGLCVLATSDNHVTLGAGGAPLVLLEHQPDAIADDPRHAGLYHTAFLMPTRQDLARWVLHAARNKLALTGASDHAVSEAFYFDDPEANGIELYADRPPETWQWTGDELKITTDPLDIDDILREVPSSAAYAGAPNGLRIGHVHLRVGDVRRAEHFYGDALGLDVTRRRQGASFMSSGRYHHHVAVNVWHSAGAPVRNPQRAGLSWLALEAADEQAYAGVNERLRRAATAVSERTGSVETEDPWGTRLRILPPAA